MFPILIKIVKAIRRISAIASDKYPHVTLPDFGAVKEIDGTFINMDSIASQDSFFHCMVEGSESGPRSDHLLREKPSTDVDVFSAQSFCNTVEG